MPCLVVTHLGHEILICRYLRLRVQHSRQDKLSFPGFVFETQDRHFATGGSSEPTLNPEFYKMFELDCVFPTLSHLVIELFDAKVWVSCINRSRAAARTNSIRICLSDDYWRGRIGWRYLY